VNYRIGKLQVENNVTIDDYKPVYLSSPGKEADEVVRDWIVLNFPELMNFWKGQKSEDELNLEEVL
jgi:hypothetical protein